MASRLKRAVPVTVNDVLDGHAALDLECLDRLYLHGYLGQLQVGGQVIQFLAGAPELLARYHNAPPASSGSGIIATNASVTLL